MKRLFEYILYSAINFYKLLFLIFVMFICYILPFILFINFECVFWLLLFLITIPISIGFVMWLD